MAGREELPVLAMTANVFEEDRQACMAAGMNDFVAKPVDLENLYSTIAKWLPKSAASLDIVPPLVSSSSIKANDDALLERLAVIKGMDVETGLGNMLGDMAGYLRLLHQFDIMHGEDIRKLSEHLVEGEIEEARRIAHTIKGAAGTLGLTQLREAARALEENLRSFDSNESDDEVHHYMAVMTAEQSKLHEVLASLAEQMLPESTVEADPVEAQKVLNRLEPLLAIDDTEANSLFTEFRELLRCTFGSVVEQLEQQIETFDYPAALKTIASISISVVTTSS